MAIFNKSLACTNQTCCINQPIPFPIYHSWKKCYKSPGIMMNWMTRKNLFHDKNSIVLGYESYNIKSTPIQSLMLIEKGYV